MTELSSPHQCKNTEEWESERRKENNNNNNRTPSHASS